MASRDDNINYSGPSKDWTAPPGASADIFRNRRTIRDADYSNLALLRRNLDVLISETTDTVIESEKILKNFNLTISPDSELDKAQEAEWPAALGVPKDYVTYSQHKTMGLRSTRGSNFIRKEYNNSARGAWGTTAADVALIAENIKSEAIRINTFLDNYISEESNDPSQQRTVELFQDWALKAIESSGQFRYLIAAKDKTPERYSQSELDQTTPAQAKNFQAILQVQLNEAASDIDKVQEELGKHLGGNADLFYDSYLGPAIKFRRQISATILPSSEGNLVARDMYHASRVLDDNTNSMLSDLMKRNEIYTNKIGHLVARVAEADMRRKAIQSLAVKGTMPKNPFVPHVQVAGETDFFEVEYEGWLNEEVEDGATPNFGVANRFQSEHNEIYGREAQDAHPQYLLKHGGTITGDISVEAGVKVDGVDISLHAHSGEDGSPNIDGSAIIPGTLPTTAFETGTSTSDIDDLRLVEYNTATTAVGDIVYEATVAWEGPDDTQFEVQVTRI
jgi:hypothetical protein